MTERGEILSKVMQMMGWTKAKAILWYKTPNPMLGLLSPQWLVMRGRGHKVLKFIEDANSTNRVVAEWRNVK